jgi:hypothetical protein
VLVLGSSEHTLFRTFQLTFKTKRIALVSGPGIIIEVKDGKYA